MIGGGRYVAVGSSFAAGPGIGPVVDRAAGRSGRNYPHLVAAELGLDLVDVTYSGATTATILHDGQGDDPPQIEAIGPDTALVTITAGGNDLEYIGTLIRASVLSSFARPVGLLSRRLADRIRARADYARDEAAYDVAADALTEVVTRTQERAPEARILLVDYLAVIGPETRPGVDVPLDDAQLTGIQEIADGLATVFATAAKRAGVDLVTPSVASKGHAVGAAEPWTTGFSLRPERFGGFVPYHPNAAGMAAVADLVVRTLRA